MVTKRYPITVLIASFLAAGLAAVSPASGSVTLEELKAGYYLAQEEERPAVLKAIRQEGSREGLEFTLQLLGYPDVKVRMEAVDALRLWGDDGYRALFEGMENPEINWICESVFVEAGRQAIPFLAGILDDGDECCRARAAYLLGVTGDSMAVGPLYAHLKDPSREVRIQVIQALCDLGSEEALGPMMELFEEEDVGLADFVLLAAERFGWRAAPILEMSLRSENERIRSGAALALGRIKVPDTIPILEMALDDPYPGVRRSAVRSLGAFGDMAAAEGLLKAAGDPDMEVQDYASDGLADLAPEIIPVLIGRLSYPDPLVRKNCIGALRKIGDRRAVEPIIKALNDPDETVRMYAVTALMEFGDPRAIKPLIERLKKEQKIHWLVSFAFMEMGSEAVEELLSAVGSEEFCYTRNLIILRMGDRALETLHLRAGQGQKNARMNAIALIGELARPESLPVLGDLLVDEEVGWVAGNSLAGMGDMAWDTLYREAGGSGLARTNALAGISAMDDPNLHLRMVDCLAVEDAGLRTAVSEPLVEAGAPVVPLVVERMQTVSDEGFRSAVEILCRINDPRARRPLTAALLPEPGSVMALEEGKLMHLRQAYLQKGSILAVRGLLRSELTGAEGRAWHPAAH